MVDGEPHFEADFDKLVGKRRYLDAAPFNSDSLNDTKALDLFYDIIERMYLKKLQSNDSSEYDIFDIMDQFSKEMDENSTEAHEISADIAEAHS